VNRSPLKRRLLAPLCLALASLAALAAPAAACSWDYIIWMPRERDADPLYRFIRGDKAGYIDGAGKVVIEPKFEVYGNHGGVFRDGLMETGVSSGEYVDTSGNPVVTKEIVRGWDFSEGLAAALDEKTKKWGYIDRTGEFAISPRFEGHPGGYVSSFSEGLALIKVGDRYGFIDRTGEFVVSPTFLSAADFRDGMARVVAEGPCSSAGEGLCAGFRILGSGESVTKWDDFPACKYTFVDRRGTVLEARFDGAKDFSEGLAAVMRGEKWGYVDKSGRFVVEPRFDAAQPFSEGLAQVTQGKRRGFIDRRGQFVIPPRFDYADDFSEGLAAVGSVYFEEPGGLFYIDRQGRTVIPGPFHVGSHFFKGLAHVELEPLMKGDDVGTRRYAYIDARGKTVFAYEVEQEN
jgi:hypothetical protein